MGYMRMHFCGNGIGGAWCRARASTPRRQQLPFGQPADNAVLALARGLQVVDVRLREPAHEAEQRAWSGAGRGLDASQRRGLPRGGGGAAARKRVGRLRGWAQGCDWGVWRRRTSHDMAKAAVFWGLKSALCGTRLHRLPIKSSAMLRRSRRMALETNRVSRDSP